MKIIIAAFALAIASPAVAQTAPVGPAADPHAQHQPGQHPQTPLPGQPQGTPQGQHQGHGMQGGCCADRNGNGRMDCCENMAAGSSCSCCGARTPQAALHPQPQGTQNH